ncbi:F-box domain containing protein [Colletotrichum kahawae]|uniref:F-box domain containing protein n=1 Tax=Colletotrichum kahawae TaxID=34407 RepID=A0AAD9YB68_COLKA|nr:F-box domain containing protein [Colletotrichum kahawae]
MANLDNTTAPHRSDLSNTRSHTASARGRLLRLPPELLLDIIDCLGIVTVALLSRTCARFRDLAHRDWEPCLRQLRSEEKLAFWAKLAFDSPNHTVCDYCYGMHRISLEVVPQNHAWSRCSQNRWPGTRLDPYKVRFQHVKTALKLSRLGNIHQEYLERLMTPFVRDHQPGDCGSLQYYAAIPRIISGGYFLRKEWIFKSGGECHFEDVIWQIRREPLVCYFMIIASSSLREWDLVGKYRFENTTYSPCFWDAVLNIGKEFKGKCANCCSNRTEYSILCPDKYRMVIRAWYDYGTETHDDICASISGYLRKMPGRGFSRPIREIFNE